MESIDFNLGFEKVKHPNIQWINDGSPLPQHGQHLGPFSVTLPHLKIIVVLYIYPHLKRNFQLKSYTKLCVFTAKIE